MHGIRYGRLSMVSIMFSVMLITCQLSAAARCAPATPEATFCTQFIMGALPPSEKKTLLSALIGAGLQAYIQPYPYACSPGNLGVTITLTSSGVVTSDTKCVQIGYKPTTGAIVSEELFYCLE